MNKMHTERLVSIAGDLEKTVMHLENMSLAEIDKALSAIYIRMTETVGAILLEQDEMGGMLE